VQGRAKTKSSSLVSILGGWIRSLTRARAQSDPEPETADEAEDSDPGDASVEVEITDAIDLHTFAPRDVLAVVTAYLDAASERGMSEVRLIHGKGKGIQRDRVRRLLAQRSDVTEFFDGTPQRGGWGATIVRLRSRQAATNPANRR